MMRRGSVLLLLWLWVGSAAATIDTYQFQSPEQEQRFRLLIDELRCPKCQNTNLAGSDAPVAQDLKNRTYELLQQGKSDAEIRAYLVDRYGDFISYRPPLRGSTGLLWFGPLLVLVVVAFVLVWRLRRRPAPAAVLSAAEQQRLSTLLDDSQDAR